MSAGLQKQKSEMAAWSMFCYYYVTLLLLYGYTVYSDSLVLVFSIILHFMISTWSTGQPRAQGVQDYINYIIIYNYL